MRRITYLISALSLIVLAGCHRQPAVPKPYGYFRIDLPSEHLYAESNLPRYPYTFLLNVQAEIMPVKQEGEHYWIDIRYPRHNAVVHCSYKPVRRNLGVLVDDAVEFVFNHAVKADAIPEQAYENPQQRVYGLWFDLEGNTATPLQFFLTDSTAHFFRAALYFNNIPNQDSTAPVAAFIREDMQMLIESFRWTDRQ